MERISYGSLPHNHRLWSEAHLTNLKLHHLYWRTRTVGSYKSLESLKGLPWSRGGCTRLQIYRRKASSHLHGIALDEFSPKVVRVMLAGGNRSIVSAHRRRDKPLGPSEHRSTVVQCAILRLLPWCTINYRKKFSPTEHTTSIRLENKFYKHPGVPCKVTHVCPFKQPKWGPL